jgi:hypothetical protein
MDRRAFLHYAAAATAALALPPLTRPLRPRGKRLEKRVVAVLVSVPEMEARVRAALGEQPNELWFTSSWAELQAVVARANPIAIIADPQADASGDPERHLAELAVARPYSVILYTRLSPRTGAQLLNLGRAGIRNVIFCRLTGEQERFRVVVEAAARGWSGPPLQVA